MGLDKFVFCETYKDIPEILSSLVREFEWLHNTLIMIKLSTLSREFIWSHNTLIMSQFKKNNLNISGYGIE